MPHPPRKNGPQASASIQMLDAYPMRLIFISFLIMAMVSCSKKHSAPMVHFDPSDFHLSKTEIQTLAPNELRSKAFGVIMNVFEAKKVEDWSGAAKSLPQSWRALYTALELQSEVANGGFHQYFYNTRCQLIEETRADLRFIGATEFLDIFEKAVAGIDIKYYTSPKRGEDDWNKFTTKYADQQWDDLEKRFYAQKPELEGVAIAHIKAHPDEYE